MVTKYIASKSGYESGFVVLRAMLMIGVFTMVGAVATLMPTATATPSVSAERTATADSPTAYFPAQYVNQATEIEPMPPTF